MERKTKETIGMILVAAIAVCTVWVVVACVAELSHEASREQEETEETEPFVEFDGDPDNLDLGTDWTWDEVFLGEDLQSSITVSELLDRMQALQNTIAACCGTETRDVGAEQDLSVMVKLRLKVEKLEKTVKLIKEAIDDSK